MARGNIDIAQIQDRQKHGNGTQLQLSDGTGVSGNFAKFAQDGSITDSGSSSGGGGGYWQGGSGGAIYYSGGNVGIGTGTPQTPLDIQGYSTVGPQIQAGSLAIQSLMLNNGFFTENLYASGGHWRYRNTGYGSAWQFANGQVQVMLAPSGTAGANVNPLVAMTILNNGNMGLGNQQSPAFAIDLYGDVNVSGAYRVNGSPLAAANIVNAVDSTQAYANPAWITSIAWSKVTGAPPQWSAGSSGAIYYSGGNVGIGTSAPVALLHVYSNSANAFALLDRPAGMYGGFAFDTAGVSRWLITVENTAEGGSNAGSNFQIRCYNDAGSLITTPLTIIRANGNVGIGTTSPTSPLQVVGLPTYASDSAAGTGGLTSGAFYKDSTGGLHVKL